MDESWNRRGGAEAQFSRRLRRRDPEVVQLLVLVAAELGVPSEMLMARSRCRAEIVEARWLAMYLAHVALGRSILSLARLFRRNWSTVSRACMRLEDRRDRPEIDAFITHLEALLAEAAEARKATRGRRRHARR